MSLFGVGGMAARLARRAVAAQPGYGTKVNALPLDSPRWLSLKAHFGNAGQDGDLLALPTLLARWHEAVGSYAEEYAYADVFESYLHQTTILDVAYAVVPHLAGRLLEVDADRRAQLLDDLAQVEATRTTPREEVEANARKLERNVGGELGAMLAQSTRDRHPELPADLADAYLAAVARAKAIAGAAWGQRRSEEPGPQHYRRHVRFLRIAGWTDDDVRFARMVLKRASDEGELIFLGLDRASRGLLEASAEGPPGWVDRTGLRGPDASKELGFLAVHSLSWLPSAVDVETMLRSP